MYCVDISTDYCTIKFNKVIFSAYEYNFAMEYQMIKGTRRGSVLVYTPKEKHLYVFKIERNGIKEYICYQTILCKPKKRGTPIEHVKCTARVSLISERICERNFEHSNHPNHESIVDDLEKRNRMNENASILKSRFPLSSQRISTREIFQQEYVR